VSCRIIVALIDLALVQYYELRFLRPFPANESSNDDNAQGLEFFLPAISATKVMHFCIRAAQLIKVTETLNQSAICSV